MATGILKSRQSSPNIGVSTPADEGPPRKYRKRPPDGDNYDFENEEERFRAARFLFS